MMIIKKSMLLLLLPVIIMLSFATCMTQPKYGRLPRGERLDRIQSSPNYGDGAFQNQSTTNIMTTDKSWFRSSYEFLFNKVEEKRPGVSLPFIKTDLKQLNREDNVLIWMGHSSLFIQVDSVRFLIDPVLVTGSPVFFVNRAFAGTQVYSPDDIPDIDYLIITHDHFDHLDYKAVTALKDRIGKVICGLGVGEHFERWKFKAEDIIELDWNETTVLKGNIVLHALPARHYSGRGLFRMNKSLWVSYMIEALSANIYISGDSGYDTHLIDIAKEFPKIDLAVLENGQYDIDWRDIHFLPEDLEQAINDLNPTRILTVHNSKYALGKHSWKEPLEKISSASDRNSFALITPMIGEIVYLQDTNQKFSKWWE